MSETPFPSFPVELMYSAVRLLTLADLTGEVAASIVDGQQPEAELAGLIVYASGWLRHLQRLNTTTQEDTNNGHKT